MKIIITAPNYFAFITFNLLHLIILIVYFTENSDRIYFYLLDSNFYRKIETLNYLTLFESKTNISDLIVSKDIIYNCTVNHRNMKITYVEKSHIWLIMNDMLYVYI